ncbi:Uncharacterised protein [Mycobacteroides abscessus subsp. abscessus]|nr:Uncharacterised protein [Mycobacteroides abscessus subsp. abscessus]
MRNQACINRPHINASKATTTGAVQLAAAATTRQASDHRGKKSDLHEPEPAKADLMVDREQVDKRRTVVITDGLRADTRALEHYEPFSRMRARLERLAPRHQIQINAKFITLPPNTMVDVTCTRHRDLLANPHSGYTKCTHRSRSLKGDRPSQ